MTLRERLGNRSAPPNRGVVVTRVAALALALLVIPAALSIASFLQDAPVRLGEPAPRTIVAPDLIRVHDVEATERARREAADSVPAVLVDDDDAKAAIVQEVRDVFARVAAVREPGEGDDGRPSADEQLEALRGRLGMLGEPAIRRLVSLGDSQLARVADETVQIAQQLARSRIAQGRTRQVADEHLHTELVVRSFPSGVAEDVVAPIIRSAARPTVRIDEEATAAARDRAARDVADVNRTFAKGSVIVSAGDAVDEVQLAALRQRGLEGSEPWSALGRTFLLALVLTGAVSLYLRAHRPAIWASGRRLILLAAIVTLFAATLEALWVLTPTTGHAWLYLLPAGAAAMLATVLFDAPVGVLVTIPVVVLTAHTMPGEPGVVAFAALASLWSVPLVSRLSARNDLRRAALHSTLGYVVLASLTALVFDTTASLPTVALAGLVNGALTAVIVNGSLPFMESAFGILTATSLLDLADRNHPLLRALEQKALGSYNHSIMVSTLVERACRAIDADSLLASTAALYHDIGKVKRPYFFVENQFGVSNPHDTLEPRVSAVIIQDHVTDGIEMARSVRLPPEIVEGIATHHGTTLVSYFHSRAVERYGAEAVDETEFRYKGRKPASKEMAVLMLADCCEGAARAAAIENRNLTKDDLEAIVRRLVAERVEDGQLDESALTFRDLAKVQESFIETLVGVYHPRIAYPDSPTGARPAADPVAERETDVAAGEAGDPAVPASVDGPPER